MILIPSLLIQLKMNGAQVFPGATLTEVQAVSILLVKAGFPRIPRGYLTFLEQSDGFQFADVELFSCGNHERAGTVFNQPTLEGYQTKYAKGKFFASRLVLGRALESLICYNAQSKCYELIHRDSLQVMLKFPRFVDIFYHLFGKIG